MVASTDTESDPAADGSRGAHGDDAMAGGSTLNGNEDGASKQDITWRSTTKRDGGSSAAATSGETEPAESEAGK